MKLERENNNNNNNNKLKLALKTKASLISEGSLQAEGVFNKLFLIYSVKQGNNLLVISLC